MYVAFLIFLIFLIFVLIVASYIYASFGLTAFWGAPYVGTPKGTVREMLELIDFQPGQTITDLGSGTGTILIVAVKEFGASRAIGYEIHPVLVWISRMKARWNKVDDHVEFRRGNFFKADLEPTDVLGVYLLTETMDKLQEKLKKSYDPDTLIVSRGFTVPGIKPVKQKITPRRSYYVYRVGDLGMAKK
ncbi:MAG: 50S ribosomal protein L11 methyltransferase [Patescibacteria group bacterium]